MPEGEVTDTDRLLSFMTSELMPELRETRKETQNMRVELARTTEKLRNYDDVVEDVDTIKATLQGYPQLVQEVGQHSKDIQDMRTQADYKKAIRESIRAKIALWVTAGAVVVDILSKIPWHNFKLF